MSNLTFIFQEFEKVLNCKVPKDKSSHDSGYVEILWNLRHFCDLGKLDPFEKLKLQLLLLSVLAMESEAKTEALSEYDIPSVNVNSLTLLEYDIPTDVDNLTESGNIFLNIMNIAASTEEILACLKLITETPTKPKNDQYFGHF